MILLKLIHIDNYSSSNFISSSFRVFSCQKKRGKSKLIENKLYSLYSVTLEIFSPYHYLYPYVNMKNLVS